MIADRIGRKRVSILTMVLFIILAIAVLLGFLWVC